MDDIIHLLPDSVANQIAAGEVVQRPASIVKEMMENSIDAGAGTIQVLVVDGGKNCVQVIDDGKGMSETDARLSFERHATSKILKASDLFALSTMGFRGEALASIAAVAQVELKTRRAEDELGTHIVISGSKIESQEPVSCSVGANFSVKNLFFNVPARRKFLKSTQTELTNILTEFERVVLVNPDIAFNFYNNGVEMYNLPKASVRQRILDVFGKKINSELLPVEAETSLVSVSGYIGKPESSRKRGSHQYFFVNGRYMRHPYFHSAVMHAYENMIPSGEQVSYFLYFSVDASSIDVNVHPTKTEIKFDNEQAIWQVLSASVKETLGKFNNVPMIDFDVEGRPDIPAMGASMYPPTQPGPVVSTYNPFKSVPPSRYSAGGWEKLYERKGSDNSVDFIDDDINSATNSVEGSFDNYFDIRKDADRQQKIWADEEVVETKLITESANHCFQFKGKYIITTLSSGIVLVDQHRAHSRILYERYIKELAEHRGASQGVLFPEIVQFSQKEAVVVDSIMDELCSIGFDVTSLGGASYSINGVPSGIEGLNPVKLLADLVSSATDKAGVKLQEGLHEALASTLASSAAISYGQVLSDSEMQQLLCDLFMTVSPARTPDGKSVYHLMSLDDVECLFR